MDDDARRAIALFRFGVLGPLVSARLDHGDRTAYFEEAAARRHVMPPDGRIVRLSPRTIEAWFHLHQRGGFDALIPSAREDKGTSRAIRAEVAEVIIRAKREKPRRSVRRIIATLERAGIVTKGELARATVHRLLVAAGISARPVRGPAAERRSFLAEHAGDLWVGDALHPRAPVIAPDGKLRKVILFSQIDNATRFILHSYFAIVAGETPAAQEYGLKQAVLKYGRGRAYYVDRGSAYIAHSLRDICAELDIHLLHAGSGDAEAKGVIERWHRTWREEVEDELPEDTPLPIADLSAKHWAWLGAEYHARKHETTGRVPRDHLLAEAHEIRAIPRDKNLDEIFLHRETRKVRKDGTVRWRGGYLEVRSELSGKHVQLRFDPGDEQALPRVFVDDKFFCDTVPLDRLLFGLSWSVIVGANAFPALGLSHPTALAVSSGSALAMAGYTWFARRAMTATALNRGVIATAFIGIATYAVIEAIAWWLGLDMVTTHTIAAAAWVGACSTAAVFLDRALVVPTLGFLSTLVVCLVAPAHRQWMIAASEGVLLMTAGYVLTGGKRGRQIAGLADLLRTDRAR